MQSDFCPNPSGEGLERPHQGVPCGADPELYQRGCGKAQIPRLCRGLRVPAAGAAGRALAYFTPTAEISIDINLSIELSVNRFDRVIAVTGFNEDGQELSSELDVKYMNYIQAVEQVLRHDSVTALLSVGEVMAITVVGPDGRQSAELLSGVETCTAGQGNIDCYSAQPEEAATAHEAGLSCGKYRAFLELQLLDPNITPEAVQGMTVREIRDMLDRLSPDGGWGGGHHGNGGGHGGWRCE